MGFKALGLDAFAAESPAEAGKLLRRLTRESEDEYAIIYIEENFAAQIQAEIIVIPGREGSSGLGLQALKAAVERAVGTNILGD